MFSIYECFGPGFDLFSHKEAFYNYFYLIQALSWMASGMEKESITGWMLNRLVIEVFLLVL